MDRLDNNTLFKIVGYYKNKERELFDSLMENIPSKAEFHIGGSRYILDVPTDDELVIWNLSTLGKTEYGSLRTLNNNLIVRGNKDQIVDLDPIEKFVEEYRTEPIFFSHTHWNSEKNPIPSRNDLRLFGFLVNINHEIHCRVVTRFNSRIRSIEYLGV